MRLAGDRHARILLKRRLQQTRAASARSADEDGASGTHGANGRVQGMEQINFVKS